MYTVESDAPGSTVPRTVAWVVGIAVVVTILLGVLPAFLLDLAGDAFAI